MRSVHRSASTAPAPAPAPRAATPVAPTRGRVDSWQAQVTYWDAGSAKATTLHYHA